MEIFQVLQKFTSVQVGKLNLYVFGDVVIVGLGWVYGV
jgi:hypothetical protein